MKIAYIILAHKNVLQIRWLVEAIQGDNVSVYLHLDKLAGKQILKEAKIELEGIQKLTFLKRNATNWGSYGLIKATLDGIQRIILDNNFDYVILLSGQDYPIKPPQTFERFLQENDGISFMEYYSFPHPFWTDNGGYNRIEKWYVSFQVKSTPLIKRIRGIVNQTINLLLPKRKFPLGFTPYGGSQWWCLHRDCIFYLDKFIKQNKKFIRFFHTVRIPDEVLFHTILMNSPLKNKITNRKLTFVDWNGPPFPRILSEKDLNLVMHSDNYFARKFDSSINKAVLNMINIEILSKSWDR